MSSNKKHLQAVIDYYDQTRFDYNVAWLNKENLAVHFGFYDEHADKHADALSNTNRILADLAEVEAGDLVLDAGCGKGGSCFWLAKHRLAKAIGISPVATQIKECRAFAKELNLGDKVQFEIADYCATPFPNEHFDVIWACESLCHAEYKLNFYKEAFRILKPGGRLIIAEYLRTKRTHAIAEEQLLMSWLNRWAIQDIDTKQEHQQHAQMAGFSDIDIADYTSYTWISLKNLNKISKRWLWIGKLLRLLGFRSKLQHGNQVGSIQQFKALNKGLWYYGVITAKK
ncbi:MAG: methyltransferase domain-containing protein [Saprospiraceae bacterium]|jgi:cyclopropane fatty-acyl-phospholipid synthase-like methyltransferase|nr:methyltransferase domain-containing protein [Saprospiraceae bacterium]